jgi:uncharacterized membrane protein YhhN
MKKSSSFLAIAFSLVTAVDILGIITGNSTAHFITKPLLMPILAAMLYFGKDGITLKKWVLAGLFFSFVGDVALLYEYKNPLLFIIGLAAFLITHICYIVYFLSIHSANQSLLRHQPWLAALVAGYGVSLVLFLYPGLGNLKIPVILYAAIICSMLLCSLHIFYKTWRPVNIYFLMGAGLFVVSDSLLAISKFYAPFWMDGTSIMLTYCVAQFCIVRGAMLYAAGSNHQ